MQYPELITDDRTFLALREQCDTVFRTDRRLPEKVFRHDFSSYCAFEHGQILRREFAAFLTTLAKISDDTNVNYMTIEPDPVEYYRKHCGFYGLSSFDPATLMDNYIKVMYRDGHVDSFRARGGDVGVLWGASLKWGIFCDRRCWELCILGSDVPLDEATTSRSLGCMDPAKLASYISNLYQNKDNVSRDFVSTLEKNYPNLR